MRRRGTTTKKKVGSAPSIPFVDRIKNASDPEQIMTAVDKLKEGISAVKALEDTFDLCKNQLAVLAPKFAIAETPIADCVLLRKAMIALGFLARFEKAPEEMFEKLQEIMDDLLLKIVNVDHDTVSALGMKTEALGLMTRFVEAFEEEALPFVATFTQLVITYLNKYVTLLSAGDVPEPTAMVYNDFVTASSTLILVLFQLDLKKLVELAPQYFPAACKLATLIKEEQVKGELIELVGNTGLLSLRSAADPENLDDDSDDEDDMHEEGMEEEEEEEEGSDKLDFLDKKLMHHDPASVPVYSIGAEVPFDLLKAVATEAIGMYSKYVDTGAEHLLGTAPLMGILVGITANYFSVEQQKEMMDMVFPCVFNALKGSSGNLVKAKAILSTLRDVIKYTSQAALSSKFDQVYETLQTMHHAAKDTLKAKTGGKKAAAKAKYTKFRASVLKCLGRLMQKDPAGLVPHADKFMKETAPLFADPGLLADFVTSLYSANDEAVKTAVKDTHLPKVMAQLTNEVKKTTISTFIRTSILSAIAKIANKCGPLFETYVGETLPHFLNFLKADFTAAGETINSIAEIVDGIKNSAVLAKILPEVCTAIAGVITKGLEEDKEFRGFGAGKGQGEGEDDEEEEEEDDMYPEEDDLNSLILYKALCALTYFVRTPEVQAQVVATVPAEQQKAIFEQILADASKENYFDDDPALKIPEIELLTDMVQKLPAIRTEANKKRLLEAFGKIPIDFEELQEATEKLENLKIE